MDDLWGEELLLSQRTTRPTPHNTMPTQQANPLECRYYGHTWQRVGLLGEKQCTVCHIKGYCPGCTSNPPADAQPFYCTRHTPAPHRSEAQA